MVNAVITAEQGREILGGRQPLGIAEYEQACALLRACLSIEDAKRFATFAEAHAAWARVNRDQEALRLSKALILHAAAQMARMAMQERQQKSLGGAAGSSPGPRSLLIEHGMTVGQAGAALKLAREPSLLARVTSSSRPPGLGSIQQSSSNRAIGCVQLLALHARANQAKTVARSVRKPAKTRAAAELLIPWLKELLRFLPEERK